MAKAGKWGHLSYWIDNTAPSSTSWRSFNPNPGNLEHAINVDGQYILTVI